MCACMCACVCVCVCVCVCARACVCVDTYSRDKTQKVLLACEAAVALTARSLSFCSFSR